MGRLAKVVIVGLAVLLSACSEPEAPPAPLIEVVAVEADLTHYRPKFRFVGRLEAQDDVSIKAKVSGYLTARYFTEGESVALDEPLYEIDPAPYEAELAKAQADLSKARSNLKVAERNYVRGQQLVGKGAISRSEMDQLEAAKLGAEAELEAAQARLKSAQVNLSYTRIAAPISGRIGKSAYSVGDLVGPDTGPLTTLVSIDPIKAVFQVSEMVFLSSSSATHAASPDGKVEIPDLQVEVILSNRERYPYEGYLDYIANRIDEATGTIEARAAIPNPHGLLRPGQYVQVNVSQREDVSAVMVPQAALQADQQGSYLMLVDEKSDVERRNVITGDRVGANVVITQGVEPHELVILRGLQKVRPGQRVKVQRIPAEPQESEKRPGAASMAEA